MLKFARKIASYLKKECIPNQLNVNTWKANKFIFVFTYIVLFLLKPYELVSLPMEQLHIYIAIYSIIYCIAYSLSIIIFMPFNTSLKWTKFKEFGTAIIFILISWLLILGVSLYFHEVFYPENENVLNLLITKKNTLSSFLFTIGLGSLILVMLYFLNLNTKLHIYNKQYKSKSNEKITIIGKNKNEYLELFSGTFIYAKSEGHYVKIYYFNAFRQVRHYLMRNTMKELEKFTEHCNSIYKCHKSYLVNLSYIKSLLETSNKAYIYMLDFKHKIPVSKDKIAELKGIQKLAGK
ncbi:hypothetical protein GWK08_06290 [Leptobacterium flavescens]|uniref:HTH LytTR-type domain-containing protein n=1 Tax=Leptobacterium flavescens TaxID=472055 RepID=A0A6P0UKU5_9FLAO|nr:LytTR family DNA-binding domain-containing protein [Leptobacterium flavescens]NER13040.1 hypothetical protein [Leptobacterium flavescens]